MDRDNIGQSSKPEIRRGQLRSRLGRINLAKPLKGEQSNLHRSDLGARLNSSIVVNRTQSWEQHPKILSGREFRSRGVEGQARETKTFL